jgi:anti-sigma regulatory factor (Ser/Thr protein kinase)
VFTDSTACCSWRREFPGTADQIRQVRVFAAALLADCPFLADILLGVDELAVNTLRHTRSGEPGGCFSVELRRWYGVLQAGGKETELVAVSVQDQGGQGEPVSDPRDLDDEEFWLAESGRGLWTVARTAAGWGWFGNATGRTVTALFAASDLALVRAA